MSQAQSYANHSLYMASIMIDAWRMALSAKIDSSSVLDAAYGPASRLHLLDAYGWQLLACQRVVQTPSSPPHSATELPKLAPGIAISPEVREMRVLEESGWLSELVAPIPPGLNVRRPQNLLAVSSSQFDCVKAGELLRRLEVLMDRVADAIDES